MSLHSKETHEFIKQLTGHQGALRAFIVSMMPGSPDVQDVLQDTNVVLWEKMGSYQPGTNFRAWSFAIARNLIKAQLRKNKQHLGPMLNSSIIEAINETWGKREDEDLNRKLVALDACMQALREQERELVNVRYNKGSSLEAHAQQTGRSAESLRVTLFRIRTKLRECVRHRLIMKGDAK